MVYSHHAQVSTSIAKAVLEEVKGLSLIHIWSILFTYAIRGTLYLSAWRHTVSDCGSTPPTAQ